MGAHALSTAVASRVMGSAVLALAAAALAVVATAGAVSARDGDPAATSIAGYPVTCHDLRGNSVVTVRISNLGDVGRAGVVNRVPVIVIDPHIIERLPNKLQIFFYEHECAHHVLGHWVGGSPEQEKEADCWAIRNGRDRGVFSRDDVMSFAPFIANSGGSPFGHLPGPQRAGYLLRCFDEPGTPGDTKPPPATTAAAP